jgi:hypothetical protein
MNFWRRSKQDLRTWEDINYWKVGGTITAAVFYALILEKVGFIVAATLCLFFLLRLVSSGRLINTFLVTAITVICAYILFIVALKVYMPSFPWRDFINIF